MTGFLLSSLRLNKVRDFIFYLLILFLPTQLGKHFWPEFSFIKGVRADYLSPTLYVTDILVLLIFVLFIFSKKKFLISNFKFLIKSQFLILLFVVCLVVGIVLSKSPSAGVYGLLKLSEFGFLGFYVAHNIKKLKLENILLMFSIGIIFESFLAISQYLSNGSLQGIFYFFGERFFNSLTPGIANASLGGELFLRPYGTFPHPNVLAGFLVIAMTLIVSSIKYQVLSMRNIVLTLSLVIGTIALFLTLSRVATLVWLIFIGSWLMVRGIKKIKLKTSIFYILLSIFSLLLVSFIFASSSFHYRFTNINLSDESIVQRKNLIQNSITMAKDHPIFGVGLNNFLVNLPLYQTPHISPFYLQPVHNIFLLVFAETGIIGLGFFIWFIYKTYKKIKEKKYTIHNTYYILLFSVLLLGMFDHYFLTLQQGQLLFSFILGLCWSDPETSSG